MLNPRNNTCAQQALYDAIVPFDIQMQASQLLTSSETV